MGVTKVVQNIVFEEINIETSQSQCVCLRMYVCVCVCVFIYILAITLSFLFPSQRIVLLLAAIHFSCMKTYEHKTDIHSDTDKYKYNNNNKNNDK